MAPRASLWLGLLGFVLLVGAVACLGAGIFLLTAPGHSADDSSSGPPGDGQPALGDDGNACSEEDHGEHSGPRGGCGDHQGHRSLQGGGDAAANEPQGAGRSLPATEQPRRSVGGGVALLILAALLLAASIALLIVARRRALLRPSAAVPSAKLPAKGEPGVAVIEPREGGVAAQEKSGLPPDYAAQLGPWAHPPPQSNPYYVPLPYGGVPPPTYSEACKGPG
ncbi:unnamed protein product [Lampetra planeri]